MKAREIRRELSEILRRGGEKGRRELAAELKAEVSDATLKRVLRGMISEGVIESIGQGRAARYRSSIADRILGEVDVDAYFSAEIDERKIREHFNFQLIQDELPQVASSPSRLRTSSPPPLAVIPRLHHAPFSRHPRIAHHTHLSPALQPNPAQRSCA